jgi:hypothetical protein
MHSPMHQLSLLLPPVEAAAEWKQLVLKQLQEH